MIILGIDPGYAILGYGAVEAERGKIRVIDYGVVETTPKMTFPERLERLYAGTNAIVPDVEAGAGSGIRPLGVDHELVCKAVLVQPGCSGQVVRPVFPIPGQFFCRLLGKVQAFLRFVWHCVPPSDFRI